ncbi:VOC family protein [Rhodobacterales bacterium]|nr:VOC family protein [Rhodobacterales bacterium]
MVGHATFCWNELMTRDVEKARAFYGKCLGWTFSDMPMGDDGVYTIADMGDSQVAGIFPMSGPDFEGVPEHWMSYIAVDDIDERLELAAALGAQILRPPFDVPGVGRIALLKDVGGAAQGWMTPE